jgi:hypothetical protein
MAGAPIAWGADCPISMPEVRDPHRPHIPVGGGHVYDVYGLKHALTSSDAEVFYQPTYAPLPSPEAAS